MEHHELEAHDVLKQTSSSLSLSSLSFFVVVVAVVGWFVGRHHRWFVGRHHGWFVGRDYGWFVGKYCR